jgi:hypothetical protein
MQGEAGGDSYIVEVLGTVAYSSSLPAAFWPPKDRKLTGSSNR